MRYGTFEILYDKKSCQYCFIRDGYVYIEFSCEIANEIGFLNCVRELNYKFMRISKNKLVGTIGKWDPKLQTMVKDDYAEKERSKV